VRVTFDTNTIDPAVRPSPSSRDPRLPEFQKINRALLDRAIEGAFCDTLITIEGINRVDRAAVFRSTRIVTRQDSWSSASEDGITPIRLELVAEQPLRIPLDAAFSSRLRAALNTGLLMLRAPPRVGLPYVEDVDGTFYLRDPDDRALAQRIDRCFEVLERIEARGVGRSQLLQQASALAGGRVEPWYQSLDRATTIHEQRAVERAFAEWADADTVTSHIAYGMDLFCTEDQGQSGGGPSVFDQENRAWLGRTYGVSFVTLSELAARL
jgi:hypothetical protein